jgi:hypothetical protein
MKQASSQWNHVRPESRILDPRKKMPIKDSQLSYKNLVIGKNTSPNNRQKSPMNSSIRKYRPVSPVSFVASTSDLIIPDKNNKYECESIFEPVLTKDSSAISHVLCKWNEQPTMDKITFEWKKKIYQLWRKNETKNMLSQVYDKVYLLEKEYRDIISPNGIRIKAEEWNEVFSFYIKMYNEHNPYDGEFYL